jgi:hypothetical protein
VDDRRCDAGATEPQLGIYLRVILATDREAEFGRTGRGE